MKVSASHEDWREVIYCELENQQIDFKSHQNWDAIGRVGRAKFARHAMALANTQGGYVVVGVSENENGTPNVYTGMTEAEASSFDPSNVGQSINTFADPPVSLDIVRPMVEGRRYVVMVVYPFSDIPHVCTENCEHELQRGGFYIRTPDARSKLAARASEIHPLVRRALRNQRQMLGRMLRGILYEDRQTEPQAELKSQPLLENSRRQALECFGKQAMQEMPYFEAVVMPATPLPDVQLAQLRNAVEQLERPGFEDIPWSAGIRLRTEIFATNGSLCGIVRMDGRAWGFWEVGCSGFCYIAVMLAEAKEAAVHAEGLSQTIFMALAAMGEFFSLLNHPESLLSIELLVRNTKDIVLVPVHQEDGAAPHVCRIPEIQVFCQRSAADLEGGAAAEAAVNLFAEICQRFNAPLAPKEAQALRRSFDDMTR